MTGAGKAVVRVLMRQTEMPDVIDIARVAVPESLLAAPETFGGRTLARCRVGTLQIREGRVIGMTECAGEAHRFVLPRLTEPHVHIDKCHTVERLGAVGGDLAAAVAAQMDDKAHWNADDLRARMRRGLRELAEAGCGVVRTHIDWGAAAEAPLAWHIACELREEARDLGLTLQVAALTGIDQMAEPAFADAVAKQVARQGGVLGAFVLHHDHVVAGLRNIFVQADRLSLALDFHVDEGLAPILAGLDDIARVTHEMRFEGPVLCGHACSLASKPAKDVARTADHLARSGVAVTCLPSTNLYLQGRRAGTPMLRGLTMIGALQDAGVTVVLGSDNVRDAFCPVGAHDPMATFGLAILAAHLDPPLADHLPMITTAAQSALGQAPRTIDGAAAEDLVVFDAPDLSTLLSIRARPVPLTALSHGDPVHG